MPVFAGGTVRFQAGFPYEKLHESFCRSHANLAGDKGAMHELLRSMYDTMSENAIAAAQRTIVSELASLEAGLGVFSLPPASSAWNVDAEMLQRALTDYEVRLAHALDSVSRYVNGVFTQRTLGWDLHGELQARRQHSIEHVQRMLAAKNNSLRGQAQYLVRSQMPEGYNKVMNCNSKRSRDGDGNDNEDGEAITSKRAKNASTSATIESVDSMPIRTHPGDNINNATVAKTDNGDIVSRKRKSRGDFITGSAVAPKGTKESALEKTKREAAAALEARISAFDANKRFTQHMDTTKGAADEDDDDGDNNSISEEINYEKEDFARARKVSNVQAHAHAAPSASPTRNRRSSSSRITTSTSSPASSTKAGKVTAVKSATKAVKKKHPTSQATLNDARAAAAVELLFRTQQYAPSSRSSSDKEAPPKKKVRK